MRRALFILSMISTHIALGSGVFSSKELLEANFQNTKIESQRKKILRFSYCPDNTCDILDVSTKSKEFVWDIGLVFLYYQSKFVQLKGFQQDKKVIQNIDNIVIKYKLACPSKKRYSSCVYAKMALKHNVKQLSARYDEGELIIE